jgi:hypothetical protein
MGKHKYTVGRVFDHICSVIIVLSLLPIPHLEGLWWVFVLVFGCELCVRVPVLLRKQRERGGQILELATVPMDLLVLISFLPLAPPEVRLMRLLRFLRVLRLLRDRRRKILELEPILNQHWTRICLSALILVSICPFAFVDRFWWVFVLIFSAELMARLAMVLARPSDQKAKGSIPERFMLLLDLVALISFIPLGLSEVRWLRLVRLVVLLGYWGDTLRNLWTLLNRRERSSQFWFLGATVLALTFVGAAVRSAAERQDASSFTELLWWAFRQVQDPGNLEPDVSRLGLVLLSLFLTVAGIFIVSFIIGIGTTLVEELMATSREQPLGLRRHSVLINASAYTHFFLDQMLEYYRKNLQKPRWMVLGADAEHPEISSNSAYRKIGYRHGHPYLPGDLEKIDTGSAKRIVILADPHADSPDTQTVSAVLSARRMNPRARIYAEIMDERNASAAMIAGGDQRTHVVATEHLLAMLVTNTLVAPECQEALDELIRVHGSEIHTYVDEDNRPVMDIDWFSAANSADILRHIYQRHRCIVLGVLTQERQQQRCHMRPSSPIQACGIIAVASVFQHVSALGQGAIAGRDLAPPRPYGDCPLPALLPRPREQSQMVLICGFNTRTQLLLELLMQFLTSPKIYVMIRDRERLQEAREALLASRALEAQFRSSDLYDHEKHGHFEARPDGVFTYNDPSGARCQGAIRLIHADWSRRSVLLSSYEGYELDQVRYMVIQTQHSDGDPDALSVMTCMKLLNLARSAAYQNKLRDDLHILVEMADTLKAELIEERFQAQEERGPDITVLPIERYRNMLMFQSTVVPGFNHIFLELFSRRHWHLQRIPVHGSGDDERRVSFGDLLTGFYRKHGLLLIGVEHEDEVILNPEAGTSRATYYLNKLRAVYLIAQPGRVS